MPSRISTSGSSCRSRRGGMRAARLVLLVVFPRLLVGLRARERVANHELDAHARHRIAARTGLLADRHVLRIFAKRELDSRHRALEYDLFGSRLAPAQLDDLVLAADRIGAAVQHVGDGQAAGEVAVDVDVGRIENVFHSGHRADGRAALVDRVVGDVRVRVDEARRHELAGRVDDLGARRDGDVRADRGDLAVAQHHGAVRNRALGDGKHRTAAQRDDSRLRGLVAWPSRRVAERGTRTSKAPSARKRRGSRSPNCRRITQTSRSEGGRIADVRPNQVIRPASPATPSACAAGSPTDRRPPRPASR